MCILTCIRISYDIKSKKNGCRVYILYSILGTNVIDWPDAHTYRYSTSKRVDYTTINKQFKNNTITATK